MNLEQNVRWQHVVLFGLLVGLMMGVTALAFGLTTSDSSRNALLGLGVVSTAACLIVGAFVAVSLRNALARVALAADLTRGFFDLPETAPEALIRLNVRLRAHFGLPDVGTIKPPLPAVFGTLVTVTAEHVLATAALRPDQHDAARRALANVLGMSPLAISWGCDPARFVASSRRPFHLWKRLRAEAPRLPKAELNPWVENVAIYGFFGLLIAISVSLFRRFDNNEQSRLTSAPSNELMHQIMTHAFAVITAVLMLPVYFVGKRYAPRLPRQIDGMGVLAAHFTQDGMREQQWNRASVAEHLRSLLSISLNVPASSLREETKIPLADWQETQVRPRHGLPELEIT